MSISLNSAVLPIFTAALIAGCAGNTPATASPTASSQATPTRAPTQPPSPSPSPSTAPSPTNQPPASASPTTLPSGSPPGAVIATFDVQGERYRVEVVEPDQVANAYALLAGDQVPSIPNGRIERGAADINTGWSWHIDPADFAFADMTIELCDGLPSYVEDGTLSGDRFCPWSAVVIEIEPAQ